MIVSIRSQNPNEDQQPIPAPKRMPAVKWFSPTQLVQTGVEVAKSSVFAKFADKREVQSGSPRKAYDLRDDRPGNKDDPFWIDYVADTGDGFYPSYAIASSVTSIERPKGSHLLVPGGDQVYPVASVENYDDRLKAPFREARATPAPPHRHITEPNQPDGPDSGPYLLALPGNHDWYDGLVSFRRNFCESWASEPRPPDGAPFLKAVIPNTPGEPFVGWKTLQSRSYWAVRLPHGWWMWGIDIQLNAPIDAEQLAYFHEARHLLGESENVILCTARPSWIDPNELNTGHWTSNQETLIWFLDRFFGHKQPDQVRLLLAGDKHHYAHYEKAETGPDSAQHLVTCGGGGAYLSSTHHLEKALRLRWGTQRSRPENEAAYDLRPTFPTAQDSRELRGEWTKIVSRNGYWLRVLTGTLALLQLLALWSWESSHAPLIIIEIILGMSLVGFASSGLDPGSWTRFMRLS